MDGSLSVSEKLVVKVKGGFLGMSRKDAIIPSGRYAAKLNPTSKTNLNLEINAGGKDLKIPLSIPEGAVIPEFEGELDLSAAEIGQPYDALARVNSRVERNRYDRDESCVAGYVTQRRCHMEPGPVICRDIPAREECTVTRTDRDRDGRRDRVCRVIPATRQCRQAPAREVCRLDQVAVYGRQNVSYETTTVTKFLTVELSNSAQAKVAQFDHTGVSSNTARMGASTCR
jgi:hypothetical protein